MNVAELIADRRATTLTLPNGQIAWVAAERLPAIKVLFPNQLLDPVIAVPSGVRTAWETADARVAVLRGWLEVCGPITAAELADQTTFTESQVSAALEALEGEGVVLRGSFREKRGESNTDRPDARDAELTSRPSPLAPPPEWCHRRLLARIHRLTIEGLRRLIEPVDVSTYWRYLARRQGITGSDRRTGSNGLFEIIAMLQGLDLSAIAWERDILPARVENYRPEWLDELCLGGEVAWGRLYPPRVDPDKGKPMSGVTRVVPVSLFLRGDLPWLDAVGHVFNVPERKTGHVENVPHEMLNSSAEDLAALLRTRGAMFLTDLLRESRLLPAHLEDGLGELVSRGLVTADGFSGLRQLISDASRTSSRGANRGRPGLLRQRGVAGSVGRWSLWRESATLNAQPPALSSQEVIEQWAWQLLRRWGVMFKDLLARESGAPSWWELLQVYRRLEARGEIRGGRFISGVAGEQFSMSESIRQLRLLRDGSQIREPDSESQATGREFVLISAADPLNLVGVLDDQPRVPSTAAHRLVYLDGRCVGTMIADEKLLSPSLSNECRPVVVELLERGSPGARPLAASKETPAVRGHASTSAPRSAMRTRAR